MGLTLVVIDPSDDSEIDFSSYLRPDLEFEIGGEAFNGDTDSGGTFRLEDLNSTIVSRDDLAHGRRLILREDASGSPVPLHIGRISPRTQQREMGHAVDRDRTITVTTRDSNADMSGILVDGWERPAEEACERVLAVIAAYLNGDSSTAANADATNGLWARSSTVIGDAFVNTTPIGYDMPAKRYDETDPRTIIRECCEWAGYDAFVIVNDDETLDLFFDLRTSTAYTSTLSISTDPADLDATTFAPKWDLGAAMELDGVEQASGILLIGADESRTYDSRPAVEVINDKWEAIERSEATEQADLNNNLVALLNARQEEELRIQGSILVPAEQAHLIRPGHRILIKEAHVAGIGTDTYFRAVTVRYQYVDPGRLYWIHIVLGFPVRLVRRYGRNRPIPVPPVGPTAGACHAFYFSNANHALEPATSGLWDTDSGATHKTLKTSADSTLAGTGSGTTSSAGGSGTDVRMGQWISENPIGAELAAILEAGGAALRGQIRSRSRFGIGISEAAQDNIGQMTVRLTQGNSATIRGTPYGGHSLVSSSGIAKFPAQATHVNRVHPAGAPVTLSPVSGADAGDYLVVETGYRSFTVGTTGAAMQYTNAAASDLPEDETTSTNLNAWLSICSADSEGDLPGEVVNPGEETNGTPGCYSPCGHTHPHGLLAGDGVHQHAHTQVTQMLTISQSDPTVNDDQDDGYIRGWRWINTDTPEEFVLSDGTAGAAVWTSTTAGGSGAPTTADYLVGTAQGGLSAEIVVGTTPGGELGGTWASPTVDTVHSGSSHASITTSFVSIAKWGND